MEIIMTRREIAENYFSEGYNCSQAVVLAFSDILEIDKKSLVKLSSSFGGGMGRLREVCGAVSGMFIVSGLLFGYDDPKAAGEKALHYEKIQTLAKRFEKINGSIVCRTLLNLDVKSEGPVPEARTEQYYKKRPCRELVGIAAEILEDFINEQKEDEK